MIRFFFSIRFRYHFIKYFYVVQHHPNIPRSLPSTNYVLTNNTPLHVPYYSTFLTSSATVNTVPYTFTVCIRGDIHIADCDPDRCLSSSYNDQYIRLYSNGVEVAFNDNSCSFCSVIDYRIISDTCQTYTLQQGCYSDIECSGNFTISLITQSAGNNMIFSFFIFFPIVLIKDSAFSEPSEEPTISPSNVAPSVWPTTSNVPTLFLSQIPSTNYVLTNNTPLHVPYYSTSQTDSATVNTVPYTFTACIQGDIHIADCNPDRCLSSSNNDQYIRLYSNGVVVAFNDDSCRYCSIINYRIISDTCQTYTLQQGCFSNSECSGNFTISLIMQTAGDDKSFLLYTHFGNIVLIKCFFLFSTI